MVAHVLRFLEAMDISALVPEDSLALSVRLRLQVRVFAVLQRHIARVLRVAL